MIPFFDRSKKHTGLLHIFEKFPRKNVTGKSKDYGTLTTLVWISVNKLTKETLFVPYEIVNFGLNNPTENQNYFFDLFSELHELSLSPQLSWTTSMRAKGLEGKSEKHQNDAMTVLASIVALQEGGIVALKNTKEFNPTSDKGIPMIPTNMVVYYYQPIEK